MSMSEILSLVLQLDTANFTSGMGAASTATLKFTADAVKVGAALQVAFGKTISNAIREMSTAIQAASTHTNTLRAATKAASDAQRQAASEARAAARVVADEQKRTVADARTAARATIALNREVQSDAREISRRIAAFRKEAAKEDVANEKARVAANKQSLRDEESAQKSTIQNTIARLKEAATIRKQMLANEHANQARQMAAFGELARRVQGGPAAAGDAAAGDPMGRFFRAGLAIGLMSSVISNLFNSISNLGRASIDAGSSIVSSLNKALDVTADTAGRLGGALTGAFASISTSALSFVSSLFDGALDPLVNVLSRILDVSGMVSSALIALGRTVSGALTSVVSIAGNAVAAVGGAVFATLQNATMSIRDVVGIFVVGLNPIMGVAVGAISLGIHGLQALANTATGVLSAAARSVTSIVDALRDALTNITKLATDIITYVQNIVTSVLSGLAQLAQTASKHASDFIEEANKFQASFRGMSDEVNEGLLKFAKAAGRSQLEMVRFAGTFQSVLHTLGFARDEAASFSTKLTLLAVDLASFFNTLDTDALQALESGIIGNHRALRQFGIGINEATLEMELLRMGTGKTVQTATDFQKTLARMNIIFRQTTDMQGDAIRTANSYANTLRRIQAVVEDLATVFGMKLNNAIADIVNNMGGMERIRIIMFVLFDMATQVAEMFVNAGAAALKFVSNWILALGGITDIEGDIQHIKDLMERGMPHAAAVFKEVLEEGIASALEVMSLRVQQGLAAVKMAFYDMVLLANVVGSMFSGIGLTIRYAFLGIEATIKSTLLGAELAIDRLLIRYGVLAEVVSLMGGNFAQGAMIRVLRENAEIRRDIGETAVMQSNKEEQDRIAAFFFKSASNEIAAMGAVGRATIDFMLGYANTISPAFGSAVTQIQLDFNTLNMDTLTLEVGEARAEMRMLGDDAVAAAQRASAAWMRTAAQMRNIYGSLGGGGLPSEGDVSSAWLANRVWAGSESGDITVGARGYTEWVSAQRQMEVDNQVTSQGGSGNYINDMVDQWNSRAGGGYDPWSGNPGSYTGYNWSGGYARGGEVRGRGGIDMIPARLSDGEHVVNARDAAAHRDTLRSINAGKGVPSGPMNVTNNFSFPNVTRIDDDTVEKVIIPKLERALRKLPRR